MRDVHEVEREPREVTGPKLLIVLCVIALIRFLVGSPWHHPTSSGRKAQCEQAQSLNHGVHYDPKVAANMFEFAEYDH